MLLTSIVAVYWIGAAPAVGARIESRQVETPTYRREIAPMFAEKCISCHWQDGPAPFSLETYADLKKRLELIRKVALLHTMPPGRVTSDYGDLTATKRLTDQDTVVIQHWIAGGAPEGEGQDLPPAKRSKWRMGEPSQVIDSGKLVVPPEGRKAVLSTILKLSISQRKTLVAYDIVPKSPKAMRQAVMAVITEGKPVTFPPNGMRSANLIGSWAIGYPAWRLPEHAGIDLDPGQSLEIRALYHPTGKEERGDFEIGLYFADHPRRAKPTWITFGKPSFVIPGDPEYTTLEDSKQIDTDYLVLGFIPEARNVASSVALSAKFANMPPRYLGVIAEWTPRWQGAYNFATPPLLLSGTTIGAEVSYDNSRHRIPDITLDEYQRLPKNKPVKSGPDENDELFWIHVQVVKKP